MARKTKEEAMETRERILDAAIAVFHDKGVSDTSLEDIAEAAGVTRGAIYWHFKNKVDIFSALHEQLHTSCMQDLLQKQENFSENPLNDLMEFCIASLQDLDDNNRHQQVLSLFNLRCDYSGDLAPLLLQQNNKGKDALAITLVFFQAAMDKGIIPPESDARTLALSLYCYICGIFIEFLRDPTLFDLKKQARPMIEHFFKSI